MHWRINPAVQQPSQGVVCHGGKIPEGLPALSRLLRHLISPCRLRISNKDKLQGLIQKECFLDSDDLRDLRELLVSVRDSDVLVILQSSDILLRPWCLLEMVAAIDAGVPIVAINVQGKVSVSSCRP